MSRRADPCDLLRAPELSTAEHLRALGFSERVVERFLGPLFAGILLDPDLHASSRMFEVILHCLSTGDAAVPATGMGTIPEHMAETLRPGSLLLGTAVTTIETGDPGKDGRSRRLLRLDGPTVIEADQVVVATDGPVAARLLGRPAPASRSVGCVWFRAASSPVGSPAIVLDGTNRGPVRNLAVLSDVAPSYAPPGQALIAAACPADTGDRLDERARTQLLGWFGPVVDSWQTLRVDRIEHGQPAQDPPLHPKRNVRVADGLWVCGDHRDTASIQGALFSGRRTAEALMTAGA